MSDKVTTVEDGVRKLLTVRHRPVPDFTLEPRAPGEYHDTLVWNGNRIPLFDTHFEPRLYRLAPYGEDAGQNCTLNVYSFSGSDVPLNELAYREFDIAELLLHSPIQKVTAFVNGAAANLIAVTENGCCANLDLGCTMAPGSENQCQHRLITRHGMSCDRGAGDMTVPHQINLYTQDSAAPVFYDDDEYYLYGLSDAAVAKVVAIHAILTGERHSGDGTLAFFEKRKIYEKADRPFWADWYALDTRCKKAVAAMYESDKLGRTVELEEMSV